MSEATLLSLLLVVILLLLGVTVLLIIILIRLSQVQSEQTRILQGLATQLAVMDARWQAFPQAFPNE